MQHLVVCRDLLPVLLLGFSRYKVSLVATIFFSSTYSFCRDISFFSSLTIFFARYDVLSVLCRDNLMCGYWNSYVATSTIVSRQYFCVASLNWCHDPIFMSRQHVCLVLVATMFLVLSTFMSPINLISCFNFILILRHSLLVLSMFSVATQFLCRDRTFLYSAYICVVTQFIMSRQDLSSLCWNLRRDIEKSVVTLFINVHLISML